MSYILPIALLVTGIALIVPDRTLSIIAGVLLIVAAVISLR